MVHARYNISNNVTDVGLRVFLTSFMMDSGFKRGVARNIDEGREKKVEVLIDLEEKDSEVFRKSLESTIHRNFESTDTECDSKKIKVELVETENPGWEIPELMFSSQSLLLNQTGKGVNVMKQVRDAIKDLPGEIANAIKGN